MIGELFTGLWEVWKEMLAALMEVLPSAFMFVLWVVCGILILPCVFVAGTLFPMWADWGEGSF